jgi:hypothetical protein
VARAPTGSAGRGGRALLGTSQKSGFVLSTTRGKRPFSGFSKATHALDEKIDELPKKDKRKPMPHWVLHDLRRTARSLMSRAEVRSEICRAHVGACREAGCTR